MIIQTKYFEIKIFKNHYSSYESFKIQDVTKLENYPDLTFFFHSDFVKYSKTNPSCGYCFMFSIDQSFTIKDMLNKNHEFTQSIFSKQGHQFIRTESFEVFIEEASKFFDSEYKEFLEKVKN